MGASRLATTPSRQVLAIMLLGVTGCGSDSFDGACAGVVSPGIEVAIRDSVTDSPLASISTAVATNGAIADTLWLSSGDGTGAWVSRAGVAQPGTYTVVVESPTYATWTQDRVKVREGVCGLKTVYLLALLQPGP